MSRKSRMPIDELRRRTAECLVLHGKSPALGNAVETQTEAVGVLALAGIKNREIAKALGRSPAHVATLKRATLRQVRQPLTRRLRDPQVGLPVAAASPTDEFAWISDLSLDEICVIAESLSKAAAEDAEDLKKASAGDNESGGSQEMLSSSRTR
jgi:hypothetical protein